MDANANDRGVDRRCLDEKGNKSKKGRWYKHGQDRMQHNESLEETMGLVGFFGIQLHQMNNGNDGEDYYWFRWLNMRLYMNILIPMLT